MTVARLRAEMPAEEFLGWQVHFGRLRQRREIAEARAKAGMG